MKGAKNAYRGFQEARRADTPNQGLSGRQEPRQPPAKPVCTAQVATRLVGGRRPMMLQRWGSGVLPSRVSGGRPGPPATRGGGGGGPPVGRRWRSRRSRKPWRLGGFEARSGVCRHANHPMVSCCRKRAPMFYRIEGCMSRRHQLAER